ncbi:MAG: STAS domain-containing protein [Clostridia bacterium]|nr:STAS domain-containing protein [Clostridia bacterium]
MEIKTNISNQNLIVSLSGRLDTITSSQLEDEIKSFNLEDFETVTLNMRELEYISSAGLRVVLKIHKKVSKLGHKLVLENVSNMVMEIFKMTGMADFLNIKKE